MGRRGNTGARWLTGLLLAGCAAAPSAPEVQTHLPPETVAAPAEPSPQHPTDARPATPATDAAPAGTVSRPLPGDAFRAPFEEALARIGLTPGEARCSPAELAAFGRGAFPTTLYAALQGDPTLSDRWSRVLREGAFRAAPSVEGAAMFAAGRVDATVRRTLLGDPVEEFEAAAREPGALLRVLGELGAAGPPDPDAASVPPRVQAAAALLLGAARRSDEFLDRSGARFPSDGILEGAEATLVLSKREESDSLRAAFEERAGALDLPYLSRAASEVLLAVDRAREWLREEAAAGGTFDYRCTTPRGVVELRGTGVNDVDPEDGPTPAPLLRIDLGGDDIHRGGGATDGAPDGPVSVSLLLDMGGDDLYEGPVDGLAFGAGWFGIGVCVDESGDDRYVLRGPRSAGLGAGCFGFGVLLDGAGDDSYEGDSFCMGAAAAGCGTLSDLAGSDRYHGFSYAQGFGFVRGAGVLADLEGNDVYVADDTDIRRPSPQSKEHNVSLSQGFGYGLRADYLDGHSLAGGVGILADRSGDDTYSCGVFGQGGGYWMGVGLLLEGGGNDAYSGVWYVQGATAHFAVGVLEDAGGDDRYTATMNMAQGAGHDFSLGVLLDRAGDDTYVAPNLSLGAGNANGVGFLVDLGGNDSYGSKGTTLGGATVATPQDAPSLRHGALTLGVFLDGGGTDHYGDGAPFAGDGKDWTWEERKGPRPRINERGVGVDR